MNEFYNQKKAKKYIGNNDVFDFLYYNILNNKLQNSVIIYGQKGIGKSTLIYYLAKKLFSKINTNNEKFLNDENIENSDANLISNGSHPNFLSITPIIDEKNKTKKNNIIIDQIRDLKKFINLTSINKLPKIILIDAGDYLNNNSSNALLKIIEEPNENTFFFIVSHSLHLLLPTIRSRCIKIEMKNPNSNEFKEILMLNELNLPEQEYNNLFEFSYASPGFALNYIDNDYSQIESETMELFINNIFDKDISSILKKVTSDNNTFIFFLYLIKFLLINTIKYELKIIDLKNEYLLKKIEIISKLMPLKKIISLLDYINDNEKRIFTLNLDKRLFVTDIFSRISIN